MKKENQDDKYAECRACKQRMTPGNGCLVSHIRHGDSYYSRIKAGDKDDYFPEMTEKHRCHDCGVGKGDYHHIGCTQDRCPICRGQFFLCDCRMDAYRIGCSEYVSE